jgi:hypothetical protein
MLGRRSAEVHALREQAQLLRVPQVHHDMSDRDIAGQDLRQCRRTF